MIKKKTKDKVGDAFCSYIPNICIYLHMWVNRYTHGSCILLLGFPLYIQINVCVNENEILLLLLLLWCLRVKYRLLTSSKFNKKKKQYFLPFSLRWYFSLFLSHSLSPSLSLSFSPTHTLSLVFTCRYALLLLLLLILALVCFRWLQVKTGKWSIGNWKSPWY